MSSLKALTALAFLSLATSSYACDGIWQKNTAGNWSTDFSCDPVAAGDTATFGMPPFGNVAVNLDVNATVTALNFAAVNTYTISGSNTITLQGVAASASSFLNVTQGNHVINSAIALTNDTVFTPTIGSDASINFFASISDGTTSSSALMNGPGQMTINCTPQTGVVEMEVTGPVTLQNDIYLTFDNSAPALSAVSCSLSCANLTMNSGILTLNNTAYVQNIGGGQGTGTFLLNNSGTLILNQGTINLSNSGFIENTAGSNVALGTLCFIGSTVTINGGNINLINTGSIRTAAGATNCGGVAFASSGQITINGGTLSLNNTGVLDAGSFGSLLNSLSSNPITINGGTLINNAHVKSGATSPSPGIIVGPQGTIAGNGIYGFTSPIFILNNGTAIPGIPDPVPGTMTINGTYQQSSSGTLLINISNIDAYGQISATNAILAGNLNIFGVSGIKVRPGDAFNVVTTTSGVSGTFSSIQMLNTPFIPMVFYYPNYVQVFLNAGTYPALHQSVFASMNHMNIRLEREMQKLRGRFTEKAVPNYSARNRMASSQQTNHNEFAIIPASLGSNAPLSQAAPRHTERRQQQLKREMETENNHPWNVYVGPIGSIGEVHTKRFQIGFDEWSAGAIAGVDYAFEQVGVGLLANYEKLHGDVHRNWGKFNIDQVHGSFYATYVPKSVSDLAFNGIIGGGYEGAHIRRNTGMTGSSIAKGNPHGKEFDALLGLEYTLSKKQIDEMPSNLQFIPMANLQYVYVNFQKYTEHNAGIFDLSVSSQKAQSLRSTLGAWVNYLWEWTDLSLNLEVNAAWQREYLDKGRSLHFADVNFTAPSSSMTTVGAGRNTCLAGLDLFFTLYQKYGVEASYDFEWNTLFHDHSVYVGFSVEF